MWIELFMSRIGFHGPKYVQAIEVWLYQDSQSDHVLYTAFSLVYKMAMLNQFSIFSLLTCNV